MPKVNDWASKCARRIHGEWMVAISSSGVPPTHDAIAGVILAYAQPLLDLLRESKREHSDGEDICASDYAAWDSPGPCNCGAAEWNARIDKALE